MAFLNSLSSSSTFESGQNFVAAADHLACRALFEEMGNFLNICMDDWRPIDDAA